MIIYAKNVQNFKELSTLLVDETLGIAPYTGQGYELFKDDLGNYYVKCEPQSDEPFTVEIETPNTRLIPLLDKIFDSGILLFHSSFASEIEGVQFACVAYKNELGVFTHANIILDYGKLASAA
jgi:hypothetical protein